MEAVIDSRPASSVSPLPSTTPSTWWHTGWASLWHWGSIVSKSASAIPLGALKLWEVMQKVGFSFEVELSSVCSLEVMLSPADG
ncbi:hypothetical protein GCM10007416_08250 [Kroppenstedtia guangzhouensis]|uniref:Uncharacterized protein n=1 Tax=Kroppenstedtia guangzhouensis TaxID=1274356 RepID=A0ABQ1G6I0_9BACL|nr:hypothetical protein GCM10007416_08250 [Kroppenstedtia guangzhouensis]